MTPASLAALHSRCVRAHVAPPPPWGSKIHNVETADLLELFALAAANHAVAPPVNTDTDELRDLRAKCRELEASLLWEQAQRNKALLEVARLTEKLKAAK